VGERRVERRLAAILAADVVGYSRLMGANEVGTLRALKTLRWEVIDPAITAHGGCIVKLTGDGILIEFASVVDAVACAVTCNLATQCLALAEKQGAVVPLMMGHRMMGRALLDTGNLAEGRRHCDLPIALFDPAQHRSLAMRFGQDAGVAILSFRTLGLWLLGYPEAARRDADKERWCDAETNRIAGEIALLSPAADAAKAERYFDRALRVAREQQAKSWELRAAMSMARLWRDQGKRAEARELLAPIWFTEGFDTRDLVEARAQLDGLA
jgi:hypothetical protein